MERCDFSNSEELGFKNFESKLKLMSKVWVLKYKYLKVQVPIL